MIVGLTLPAAAQGGDGTESRADEAYRRGADAFAAQDYARAAEAFETAHRLSPHPDAAFNAARSYELAGARAQAADLYQTALDLEDLSDGYVDYATEHLAALKRTLGILRVVAPVGATVTVAHARGASIPVTLHLEPGPHVVTLEAPGRPTKTQEVALTAGEIVELSVTLAAAAPQEAPPRAPGPDPAGDEGVPPNLIVGTSLMVLAAASIGAGVGLGVAALDANESWDASGLTDLDARRAAVTLRALANVSYFAGAAHAVAGFITLLVPFGGETATLRASPTDVQLQVTF
ncbi:MAG: PEGA domain-containing protein [Myxococcales bacterium]|nr:PEGA domain-containing protein [Myxococcales bacterium]